MKNTRQLHVNSALSLAAASIDCFLDQLYRQPWQLIEEERDDLTRWEALAGTADGIRFMLKLAWEHQVLAVVEEAPSCATCWGEGVIHHQHPAKPPGVIVSSTPCPDCKPERSTE